MSTELGLLVRGGELLDGTGSAATTADLRVRGETIVEIGRNLSPEAERVVDATGAVVTPGFIDVHTHLDPTFFWDADADPVALHGVTTVLSGNCSLSVAPVRPEGVKGLAAVFSYIEDIPIEAFLERVPWTWGTWAEYVAAMDFDLAVNNAGLVGHSPLRAYVMGEDAWERAANDQEREQIAAVLDESLRAGAFGLSSSFFDEDDAGRPVPARLADDAEVKAILDVLARHDALLQFVPEMLAPDPQVSIDRVAALAAGRAVRMSWTGTSYDPRTEARNHHMLDRTAELQAQGVDLTPQYSPRPGDTRVNWDRSMAFFAFPKGWQRYIHARGEEKRELLLDPAWRETARIEWDGVKKSMFPVHRPEKIKLIGVNRPELRDWLGKSLLDLVEARGGHPSDVLADWLLENDLYPEVMAVDRTNDDAAGVRRILQHPAVMLGSSDSGAHLGMMCAAGDATLALTRHVRERGDLTLASAVHQLTARAARLVGLPDRGVLRVGAVADLNVFGLDELVWDKPYLVDDLPGGGVRFRRPPGGYRSTVLSGAVVQEAGEPTGNRPGRMLAHHGPA